MERVINLIKSINEADGVVTDLGISDENSVLNISSNFESYEKGKEKFQLDSDSGVIYIGIDGEYVGSTQCVGVSIEDAKAIIKTLQSVIDYVESEEA